MGETASLERCHRAACTHHLVAVPMQREFICGMDPEELEEYQARRGSFSPETERLKLEKGPSLILSESMHMNKDSLQQYWQKVLEDNERQEERNATLLRKLGKLEEHMSILSTKTATLNTLREQYSSMMKIITSMNVEPVPWPSPHTSQDLTRNDSERLTKNHVSVHHSASHLFNNPVYPHSPSQFQDSDLGHSAPPQQFYRTVTVKDVAIQTESSMPLVCLRCGTSNSGASVTAPQDRMFRRVQSVSDLLGMNGLPKPPTPYPRMSTFSSTSSLTSQNQYATNLAETWKRNPEPGANRHYSYESLNLLSPIHSPTTERGHFANHQQMVNEVLSVLPTSRNHYANQDSIVLNARQTMLPDDAHGRAEFSDNPQQQWTPMTSESIHQTDASVCRKPTTENVHVGQRPKEQIISQNVYKAPSNDRNDIEGPVVKAYLEKDNNSEIHLPVQVPSKDHEIQSVTSNRQQTYELQNNSEMHVPVQLPSKDHEIHSITSDQQTYESQNNVKVQVPSKDQKIHSTPDDHQTYKSRTSSEREPQQVPVQSVVEKISVNTQPGADAKHKTMTLPESTNTTGERSLKDPVDVTPIATNKTETRDNRSIDQQTVVNSPKLAALNGPDEIKAQQTLPVEKALVENETVEEKTVVHSPKLSASSEHDGVNKKQQTLQVEKASLENEKGTTGIEIDKSRQGKDSSDEDDSFFQNENSFHGTDAYKMLLGSIPPAKKKTSAAATSSESSDDIENAFFSSVMTKPVENHASQEKLIANTSATSPKKTEAAEVATESKKTGGGAIPKAVTAEDRQRIAKKVMNLGGNSDSDIDLPATKHDSDSDDFFS